MPRSEAQRLQDMRDACERIAGFLAGMDLETFRADQRTIRAVLYDLVVLGEAAKGISNETRERFPHVPWRAIAGMKDVATHQYHGIMLELVWETVTVRVPALLHSLMEGS